MKSPSSSSRQATSSSAAVSAVTSRSRIGGGQPGAVVLLGEHGVELGARGGLDRGVGRDLLDGALEVAAVVGFELRTVYQITPPRPEWQPHFQVRVLSEYQPGSRGMFTYPEPFDRT